MYSHMRAQSVCSREQRIALYKQSSINHNISECHTNKETKSAIESSNIFRTALYIYSDEKCAELKQCICLRWLSVHLVLHIAM